MKKQIPLLEVSMLVVTSTDVVISSTFRHSSLRSLSFAWPAGSVCLPSRWVDVTRSVVEINVDTSVEGCTVVEGLTETATMVERNEQWECQITSGDRGGCDLLGGCSWVYRED